MAWQFPASFSTNVTAVDLGTTDDVYVGTNVSIASTSSYTIRGTGSSHEVDIDGSVAGSYAVYLGLDDTTHDQIINVSETGRVFALSYGLIAVGYHSDIVNDGSVKSKYIGVYFSGSPADLTVASTFTNSGIIDATSYAVYTVGTQKLHTENTGTIKGGTNSYIGAGAGVDEIINTGKMYGIASLGSGNDFYDGRGGYIGSDVQGGAGDDRIYGGSEKNLFHGGADNDRLYGAKGADKLYGEAGADTFVFLAASDSTVAATGRDTIYDFSHADLDKINLSAIDANSSASGNQAFKYIANAAFTHHAGELQDYTSGSGHFIRGDLNGDGISDFAIQIATNNVFVSSDFIL